MEGVRIISPLAVRRVLEHLQPTVGRMYAWANTNEFQFSIAETNCIMFHPKLNYPLKPTLQMNGLLLPVRNR